MQWILCVRVRIINTMDKEDMEKKRCCKFSIWHAADTGRAAVIKTLFFRPYHHILHYVRNG